MRKDPIVARSQILDAPHDFSGTSQRLHNINNEGMIFRVFQSQNLHYINSGRLLLNHDVSVYRFLCSRQQHLLHASIESSRKLLWFDRSYDSLRKHTWVSRFQSITPSSSTFWVTSILWFFSLYSNGCREEIAVGSANHSVYSLTADDTSKKVTEMYNKSFGHSDWVTGLEFVSVLICSPPQLIHYS